MMDDRIYDDADAANQELEERTELALKHALQHGTPEEDVRLLCYHSGIKFDHIATKTKD